MRYGIQKTAFEIEQDREEREATKKDGPGAISKGKYKGEVEGVIRDILKRPINKRVQFGEITLIIPENTTLNSKHGNIVDIKTGYGIPITFEVTKMCSSIFYRKKVKNNAYVMIAHNENDLNLNKIAQKIIKANGFKNTCN
ncbi:hypothetical protein [Leptotrichia sp. OH3620_COT-345]|uniref:hypothetical protein n=1 Tax=Leptotrichia sp. OH3620_COT-345 TaxID=2491048 RepID=UPI0011D014C1|nr:hypothetical protein [Leptotrichia sp. OH3620_COT-345]